MPHLRRPGTSPPSAGRHSGWRRRATSRAGAPTRSSAIRTLAFSPESLGEEYRDARRRRASGRGLVIRTAVIDELIGRAVAESGIDTIVNLACGLDTRAFRCDLPADLRWFDVDLPELIAYRRDRLAAAQPRCRYETIAADLLDAGERGTALERATAGSKAAMVLCGRFSPLSHRGAGRGHRRGARPPSGRPLLVDLGQQSPAITSAGQRPRPRPRPGSGPRTVHDSSNRSDSASARVPFDSRRRRSSRASDAFHPADALRPADFQAASRREKARRAQGGGFARGAGRPWPERGQSDVLSQRAHAASVSRIDFASARSDRISLSEPLDVAPDRRRIPLELGRDGRDRKIGDLCAQDARRPRERATATAPARGRAGQPSMPLPRRGPLRESAAAARRPAIFEVGFFMTRIIHEGTVADGRTAPAGHPAKRPAREALRAIPLRQRPGAPTVSLR